MLPGNNLGGLFGQPVLGIGDTVKLDWPFAVTGVGLTPRRLILSFATPGSMWIERKLLIRSYIKVGHWSHNEEYTQEFCVARFGGDSYERM